MHIKTYSTHTYILTHICTYILHTRIQVCMCRYVDVYICIHMRTYSEIVDASTSSN